MTTVKLWYPKPLSLLSKVRHNLYTHTHTHHTPHTHLTPHTPHTHHIHTTHTHHTPHTPHTHHIHTTHLTHTHTPHTPHTRTPHTPHTPHTHSHYILYTVTHCIYLYIHLVLLPSTVQSFSTYGLFILEYCQMQFIYTVPVRGHCGRYRHCYGDGDTSFLRSHNQKVKPYRVVSPGNRETVA